jgi:RNA polymerase sigma factor (sigma-70 family)
LLQPRGEAPSRSGYTSLIGQRLSVEEERGPVATRMFDRRPAAALGDPGERVAGVVARHGELLKRVARSYSLCADDAQDAVQRALEIYMRRVSSLDPATELAWLKVVVKHEALAVRRGRAGVAGEELDLDAVPAVGQRSVEERLESAERVERSAEVMRRLKRDEARALMLKAEGLSYVEIGERLGWTYTKVNRCITEGRKRFLRLYEELETGAECERLAPVLASLAAGEASAEQLLDIRPHLRNCAGCRATVRALHASRLRRVTALLPLGAVVEPVRGLLERFRGAHHSADVGELHPMQRAEQLDEAFRQLPAVAESASRASTARLNLRGWVEAGLQRLQSSDVALGVHAAASSGGGRVASIAALIGVCVSGVGAGTYCVATALLPDPKPAIRAEAKPSKHVKRRAAKRTSTPAPDTSNVRLARAQSTATPSASAQAPKPRTRRTASRQPPAQAAEFSFETSARTASQTSGASSPNSSFESGASSSAAKGSEFSDGAGGEFSP